MISDASDADVKPAKKVAKTEVAPKSRSDDSGDDGEMEFGYG